MPKENYSITNTEEKIKALLNFEHIEELFYTINILNEKELKGFIEHYKKSEISPSKDKRIDLAIRNANNCLELITNIKEELIRSVEEEIQDLRSRMSLISKKGKDVYVEKMKLLTVPLKIKVFRATGKKEDFYKIKKIISQVDEIIKPKEEEIKKESIEREQKEREKEEAEIKAKELKEKTKNVKGISKSEEMKIKLEDKND